MTSAQPDPTSGKDSDKERLPAFLNSLRTPRDVSGDPAREAIEQRSIELSAQVAQLVSSGNLPSAERALSQHHAFLSKALPSNDHLLLTFQAQLGRVLLQSGKIELALKHINSVADLLSTQTTNRSEGLQRLATSALRELADNQLKTRDPRIVDTLDRLILLCESHHGHFQAMAAELAFEKVLALRVLNASVGDVKEAICAARSIALKQKDLSPHRRGVILESLGHTLFNQGEWDEAHHTLQTGIQFLTEPSRQAHALLMLSQIAAYQGDVESGKAWLSVLRKLNNWHSPARLMIVEQVQRSLGITSKPVMETAYGDLPRGALPSDPPHLKCIKDTLIQGHALFTQGQLVVAQSVLEGAGVLISCEYHPDHFLWHKAHLLLAFTKIELSKQCEDSREEREFLLQAQEHALKAFSILKKENSSYDDQKMVLNVAYKISEALEDDEACADLGRRLQTGLL